MYCIACVVIQSCISLPLVTGFSLTWPIPPVNSLPLARQVVREFKLDPLRLSAFIGEIGAHYSALPYHNWHHGVSVAWFAYYTLITTKVASKLSRMDVLALMIASLCHDVEHTGVNNAFEIAAQSNLALVHNDRSVLENHHAFVTTMLMRRPEFNFIERKFLSSSLRSYLAPHYHSVRIFTLEACTIPQTLLTLSSLFNPLPLTRLHFRRASSLPQEHAQRDRGDGHGGALPTLQAHGCAAAAPRRFCARERERSVSSLWCNDSARSPPRVPSLFSHSSAVLLCLLHPPPGCC